MPFGRYGAKSVQGLSDLFNTPAANSLYRSAGSIGRRGAEWGDIGDITRSGRRRMGGAAVGMGLMSSSRQRGRSSGTRGLQPRSSAPTPIPPF